MMVVSRERLPSWLAGMTVETMMKESITLVLFFAALSLALLFNASNFEVVFDLFRKPRYIHVYRCKA